MSHETKVRRYLTRGKVAKLFGVTTRTVRRWERRAALNFPHIAMINGRGYFDQEDIERFERGLVRSTIGRFPSP
jgi:DNA-binding transcriptional MerR regulator